ncbi:hypothetical protein A2U01_0098797, partial [Trifolium medium]|nr:hypothetical protein [Trifolium medium]
MPVVECDLRRPVGGRDSQQCGISCAVEAAATPSQVMADIEHRDGW